MKTLEQLIDIIESRQPVLNKVELDGQSFKMPIIAIAPLDRASSNQLSFLSSSKYSKALSATSAGLVLVDEAHRHLVPPTSIALVTASPYLAYASCSQLFENDISGESTEVALNTNNDDWPGKRQIAASAHIHPSAVIGDNVQIGESVTIGPFCIIGDEANIGEGSQIAAQVSIGTGAVIGAGCMLFPQVVIGHHCQLGDRVRVHAHASIGSEGFGFAPTANPAQSGWERIAQLGRVIIGNDVRIGSQTCIDRGAIDDTVIGNHVIIDNLVQIAHNVKIGAGTAIAANTGIAGSTTIGQRCVIGGAVGISGHLSITDDVTLTAMTMVTKSITEPGSYSSGTVAMPSAKWRRAVVRFRQV